MNITRQSISLLLSSYYRFSTILVCTLIIASCSSDTNKNTQILSIEESSLSAELKTIYTRTCAVCHTRNITGAPIAGNTKQWDKVLSKGMDTTLERVINGYKGMPPAGQCFECSPDQLIEMINFMANRHLQSDLEAQP